MTRLLFTLFAAALLSAPASAFAAETYELDAAHTSVGFKVRHLGVSWVQGQFGEVSGTFVYDEKKPQQSTLEVTIPVASIDTQNGKRDDHLRSGDFFDAEKHPNITFTSTKVKATKDGLLVTGDLTMKGKTGEVVLTVEGPTKQVTDPWGNTKRGASATATIDREAWGVDWNAPVDGGGLVVGKEVKLMIDVELTQTKNEKASR